MKKQLLKIINRTKKAGFTMIELLIVIAILGILAVAVLSAINPIEQINRGKDTGSRSDAEQLLSAVDRYYTFQGYYPWQTSEDDTTHTAQAWTQVDNTVWVDSATTPCLVLAKLGAGTTGCIGAGEIKIAFTNRIADPLYNHLHVYNKGGVGDSTYICFAPKSKAFATEAKERCDATSGLPADMSGIESTVCNDSGGIYLVCLP